MAVPISLMLAVAALAVGEWIAVRSELPPVMATTFGWAGESAHALLLAAERRR